MATDDKEDRLYESSIEKSLNKQQQLRQAATNPGE